MNENADLRGDRFSGGGLFYPQDFGACGDGSHDDTISIQKAVDAAFEHKGVVVFTPGIYLTGEIRLHHGSSLRGELCNRYSYKDEEPSVRLQLREDETSSCLLNISEARGVRLFGLELRGCGPEHPRCVHGVLLDHEKYGPPHDSPIFDSCVIRQFSGDGCHFMRIFVYTFRFCAVSGNGNCGIWAAGWDGFMTDCSISSNRGVGLWLAGASCTFTGNRIEWNRKGGIVADHASYMNFTGNYIDRSGLLGISLRGSKIITCTGNLIYRSGKAEWQNDEPLDSAHVRISESTGVVFSGNTCAAGLDDTHTGPHSPDYGLVLANNRSCVIKGNALADSCLKQTVVDLGGHEDCVIGDNPGFCRNVAERERW